MAKKEKAAEAKTEKKEFTVADLASELGKETFEIRALLRKVGVEKTEGKYAWTKKSEYEAVLKSITKANGGKKADEDKASKAAPENKGDGKKQRPKPGGKK